MKKFKKNYKIVFIIIIIIIFLILSFLVCNNLFVENNSTDRLENKEKYELTKKEISEVKEILNKIENVEKVNVYSNYKIIKIYINLKEETDFKEIKKTTNEVLDCFNEKKLKFYDVEVFVDCRDKESETYPKIGYKHKSNSEFTWNR